MNPRPGARGRGGGAVGFTIIELLIVMVVLGVLAAIAAPQAARVKERSYRSTMKSDLRNLLMAQEAYFSDSQAYATAMGDLASLFESSQDVTLTLTGVSVDGWSAEATHAMSSTSCSVAVAQRRSRAPTCP